MQLPSTPWRPAGARTGLTEGSPASWPARWTAFGSAWERLTSPTVNEVTRPLAPRSPRRPQISDSCVPIPARGSSRQHDSYAQPLGAVRPDQIPVVGGERRDDVERLVPTDGERRGERVGKGEAWSGDRRRRRPGGKAAALRVHEVPAPLVAAGRRNGGVGVEDAGERIGAPRVADSDSEAEPPGGRPSKGDVAPRSPWRLRRRHLPGCGAPAPTAQPLTRPVGSRPPGIAHGSNQPPESVRAPARTGRSRRLSPAARRGGRARPRRMRLMGVPGSQRLNKPASSCSRSARQAAATRAPCIPTPARVEVERHHGTHHLLGVHEGVHRRAYVTDAADRVRTAARPDRPGSCTSRRRSR